MVLRSAAPSRLSRIDLVALGLGIAIACGFLVHQWWYPSYLYDAGQYTRMGRNIAEHGILTRYTASALRTFAYPIFLSVVVRGSELLGVSFTNLLFVTQAAAYFSACLCFRWALARLSPGAARVSFPALVLNYYALLYLPEPLTEAMSLTLVLVVAAWWLETYRRGFDMPWLAAGSLLAGTSIVVRPANLSWQPRGRSVWP